MSKEKLTEKQKEYFQLGYLIALKHHNEGKVDEETLNAAINLAQPCAEGYCKNQLGDCVPCGKIGKPPH